MTAAWEYGADAVRWAADGSHQIRPVPVSAVNDVWWCADCRVTHRGDGCQEAG